MNPEEVLQRIEEVDIQGATAVAREGIRLLEQLEEEGREEEVEEYRQKLREARPTEPLLFNALELSREKSYREVLEHIESSQEEIGERGAEIVQEGDVIYTHCHSSTVTAVLREASGEKEFEARVTETRPLYQGRETAEELAEAGIPTELYVDSAGRKALEEADRMFIGADALLRSGGAVNKIGSGLFAEIAEEKGVPVTVFADSWKLDTGGRFEEGENIEQRPPEEVWSDAPERVQVENPAFETVEPELVYRIVSELGIHRPNGFMGAVRERYPEVIE
ncbi:MAG: hypothetical protein SVS85_00045 [Candidatus Nanohaloarchaea archaeon]|nr:hypothetical protein [Candidatus Nanohaloarchaea archaeon]